MRDEVFGLIERERRRQEETIGLIPSENFVSRAVREAVGSVVMNKYSEGQVGVRYYQGNEWVDRLEALAKKRALAVFGLKEDEWGVNVQPLSGSPANLAVMTALMEPGERVLSMSLTDGGHLSHGWEWRGRKVTLASKVWRVGFYRVDEKTQVFDYDRLLRRAEELRPRLLISGGTAYPREIDHERMGSIARKVGAYYMADIAHEAGLVAAGVNKSPFAFADVVVMTTHKTLRGPRGAMIFSRRVGRDKEGDLSKLVDRAVFPGIQGGPHNETIAGIAVCLGEVAKVGFREYAKQMVENARVMAAELSGAGIDVVSGGTDKHLVLLDLRKAVVNGWVAAWALEAAGIVANRNTVPGEGASPFYPSGLRLGTPGVTTRGMKEPEMVKIAGWVVEVIKYSCKWRFPETTKARGEFAGGFVESVFNEPELVRVRKQVKRLAEQFPLGERWG